VKILLLPLLISASVAVLAQDRAIPVDTLSVEQRADYQQLLRRYLDTFRILGWSTRCPMKFDAEPHFREMAHRHGEDSEAAALARLAFRAGAEHVLLDRALDPAPPPPMPCDVMVHMQGMRLPELPRSLALEESNPAR
jgi:hypothetical protein